jgi:group I intron endonuclease
MIIYKISNSVNGKVLIGQTTQPPQRRWYAHLYNLRKQKHCNHHLQNAYNKYGESAFTFEVLDKTAKSHKKLNELEIKYIKQFNTMNPSIGYNKLSGGENKYVSDSLRSVHRYRMQKLYATGWKHPMLGKSHTTESKQKMSDTHKHYYKLHKHHSLGSHCSNNTKQKLKEHWNSKRKENPILLISPTDRIFELNVSTREFCKIQKLNPNSRRSIDRLITGQFKSAYGWKLYKSV